MRPAALVCVVVVVLAACGTGSGASPTRSGQSLSCGDGAGSAPSLCGTFVSVSGTDGGADVAWLASDPLTVEVDARDGSATLAVATPCNAIDVPVEVTGSTLVPDVENTTVGAKGCLGEASAQEAWTRALVAQPLTYELDGDTLTLSTPDAAVVLERRP
ncbi:META domain-containing protein [Cellulomonas chitinilytica]|uniref:META domain-containing protein n=1 Tax=Cellulomonas chitinilytica TaxID=398759 RepID=UPI0019458184|nr:META domain-containing protein [Cellulomonas chitinilytica]